MVDIDVLTDMGLTKNEAELYLIILKSGQLTATQIAAQTKISRPHVYDSVNKLISKGVLAHITKNNKKYFKANSPQKILEYFKEKYVRFESTIPTLEKYFTAQKNDSTINIIEGSEGIRSVFNDIIKTKNEVVVFGASDRAYNYLPRHVVDKYLKERKQNKIYARQFYYEGTKILKSKESEFRKLPKEFSAPTTTLVYGDKVSIWIWQAVPIAIMIESADLAKSYRTYFEMLWKIAKP
jgi:sugar-specific transcriptional regulator TrmB